MKMHRRTKLALGVQSARLRNAHYSIHRIMDPVLADPNKNNGVEVEMTMRELEILLQEAEKLLAAGDNIVAIIREGRPDLPPAA